MLKTRWLSLVPLLAVTAVSLAAALGVTTTSALGAECKEEGGKPSHVLCPNGEPTAKLRDDFTEPPEGVSGGNFGTSILGVNTNGKLRLCADVEPVKKTLVCNENPANDAFFGLKLGSDPLSATSCKEGAGEAEGWVLWLDIQDGTTSAASSPVFDDTSPGSNGPWPFGIRSNHCTSKPGVVTIEHVALYFPTLSLLVTGTIVGTWEQPSTTCPGGGVKLEIKQPGLKLSAGVEPEIDNGTTGKAAFICFVSANNYLFPTAAPTWGPFTGSLWKD